MDDSRIKDVSSLLAAFFDEEKLRRGGRYSDFFSSWPAFVGSRLAAHSRVVDVDKGLLVVETDHPGWIQLLQMRQTATLAAVDERFPELKLRGIVFRVTGRGAAAESKATDQVEKETAVGDELSGPEAEPSQEGPSLSEGIEDPEFKALFASLKKTMHKKD